MKETIKQQDGCANCGKTEIEHPIRGKLVYCEKFKPKCSGAKQ